MSKPLLILDLDGTLIGTGTPPLPRPGLRTFLKYVFHHFEVALWTAADENWLQYAMDTVLGEFLSSIDQCFVFIIYRIGPHKNQIKPLSYIWSQFPKYNVNNTLIVDNNPITYSHNPASGIFIPTFSDSVYDIMLNLLQKHLVECMKYYQKHDRFPILIDKDFETNNTNVDKLENCFQVGKLIKLQEKTRKRRRSRRKSHRTTILIE